MTNLDKTTTYPSFAAALGLTPDANGKFPALTLNNGYVLELLNEDGGYIADKGHGQSNPYLGTTYTKEITQSRAWGLIAQRFCGGQPKKGEVLAMAESLAA